MQPSPVTPATQEVRIASVLVGGVSLAIWMGGLMYELERVTKARGGPRGSHAVYAELVGLLDVDVSVDVLSGTSAGGINAAAFAVAQCRGSSVKSLRETWIRLGAIEDLLRTPYEKSPPSLLRGDGVMLEGLRTAMHELGTGRAAEPPPTQLFLTTTLLRGEASRFRDDYGTQVEDVDHHGVFHFDEGQLAGQGRSTDPVLDAVALAARSSASFPLAFEASRIPVGARADASHPDMANHIALSGPRWAVDGGALDNRPLGPALNAVYARTADHDVRRVLAYITPTASTATVAPDDPRPPLLGPVLRGTIDAMLAQSISGDLNRLRRHNDAVVATRSGRVYLAGLARGGCALADDAIFAAYRNRRARREALLLVDEVIRQLPNPAVAARLPSAWTNGPVGFDSHSTDLLDVATNVRLTMLATTAPTESNAQTALPGLGPELYERAAYAVLPLIGAGYLTADAGHAEAMQAAKQQLLATRNRAWGGSLDPPSGTARPERVAAVVALALNRLSADSPGPVDWITELAGQWPPPGDQAVLGEAWTELASVVKSIQGCMPSEGGLVADRFGEEAVSAQTVLAYLMEPTAPNEVVSDALISTRLAQLVIATEVLGGTGEPDQPVEIVQMSADTRTELLHVGDRYLRSAAAEKVTGLQLHHFGAFYKRSWRANDWMWGRLDGAGWLVHVLLDPRRIRSRFADAAAFETALRARGLLPDGQLPDEIMSELTSTFDSRPPPSLPRLALLVAQAVQLDIAAEELPNVAAQVRADGRDGVIEAQDTAFLARLALWPVPGAGKQAIPVPTPADVTETLQACTVGAERISQDIGSTRYTTTVAAAAATLAAVAGAAVAKPPTAMRRITDALRAVTLMLYVMAKGLRSAGAVGLAAGVAIAVASSSSGVAQTVAIVGSALLLLLLLTFGLRAEARPWLVVALIAFVVLAVAAVSLAGLIPLSPYHNWWLNDASRAVDWLKQRWWAAAVVALLALAPLLLGALRLGLRTRQRTAPK